MIYGSKLDDIFHLIRVILMYVAIIVWCDKEAAVIKCAQGIHIIKILRPARLRCVNICLPWLKKIRITYTPCAPFRLSGIYPNNKCIVRRLSANINIDLQKLREYFIAIIKRILYHRFAPSVWCYYFQPDIRNPKGPSGVNNTYIHYYIAHMYIC